MDMRISLLTEKVQLAYAIIPKAAEAIVAGTPLGRVGQPEHIPNAMIFLASEQARWVTGQVIYVVAGWRKGTK